MLLSVGRVTGHRGRAGELTVRGRAAAQDWLPLRRVWIAGERSGRFYEVERARAYRDRLVLKLKGIDSADGAARLRGRLVHVAREDAPALPDGVHYVDELEGMLVSDEAGRTVGRVAGLIATGGTDVLRVRPVDSEREDDADELLIPLGGGYVRTIDEERRRVVVSVPPELRELNRRRGSGS